MIRYFALILLSFAFFYSASYGAELDYIGDVGASAKTISIGNVEGFSNSAASVFENPASLCLAKDFSVSLFQTKFLMDEFVFGAYSVSKKTDIGTFAIGYTALSVSGIKHTGENQYSEYYSIDTFSANNSIIKAGYQFYAADKISVGVGLSYFHNKIYTYKGTGFNADAGVFLNYKPTSISISGKNILKMLKIKYTDAGEESAPTQLRLGVKHEIGDLDLYAQLMLPGIGKKYLKAGGLIYQPGFLSDFIYISAGLKEIQLLNKVYSKASIGVGLELNIVNVHFAYEKSDYYLQDNQYYLSTNITI